ncbi:NUDIX hydrolase N-terminal domain-containing protein [Sporosarcina sp. FSL K6-6792]|uniref:NUDIX hydrolase N-terminal domain-containing protein n=1 Tax=Sporosarcina sp. FSL K6-6792 TaxID=2921559 RepID=UPI0030F6040D
MVYQWLGWAQLIQALSQSSLAFLSNIYDIERYEELRMICAEIKDLFMNDTGYQTPKVDVRGDSFQVMKVL